MKATAPEWDKLKDILTSTDLAKILGKSKATIVNMMTANKDLPPHIPKSPGSHTKWHKQDVRKWYESLEA